MEFYGDMSIKYLALHFADKAQDDRWYWTYLAENKYRVKKLILLRAKNMIKSKPWYQKY